MTLSAVEKQTRLKIAELVQENKELTEENKQLAEEVKHLRDKVRYLVAD